MKIDRTGSIGTAQTRRASRTSGTGGGFTDHLTAEDAAGVKSAAGARAAAPMDVLLSVQEVDDREARPRRARERAEDILDQLDELRHGLLAGDLTCSQIERLSRLVRQRRETVTDPRLAEVLDQIELRAEIELAKYARLD